MGFEKTISLLIIISLLAITVSAQGIWSFDNFLNKYKVYKSTSCNVQGTKDCRNELSWEGNSIGFKFKLDSLEGLTNNLRFNFFVVYYSGDWKHDKTIDAILKISSGKNSTIMTVDGGGWYSVLVPKSSLKIGSNTIQMKGTNIGVGYGKSPPTVVLSYVDLETA